jgi:hypothetical protein
MVTRKEGYALWGKELVEPTPVERRGDRTTVPVLMNGFWRLVSDAKTKHDLPFAIWTDKGEDGQLKAETIFQFGATQPKNTVENKEQFERFATGWWLSAVAVTQKDWDIALRTGFWPDGRAAKEMTVAEKQGIEIPEGDNAPPKEESLADQIKSLADLINASKEPTTQAEASTLSGRLDKMRTLVGLAEAERVKQKEPHLTAGREIDDLWNAIKKPGQDAGNFGIELKRAYLKKEQARLQAIADEENRKREEAAKAEREKIARETAARLAQEAEDRRKEAAEAGATEEEIAESIPTAEEITARAEEVAAVAVAPVEKVEAQRATAGSSFGRSTGLRKVTVGEITDALAFATYLIKAEDDDIMAALKKRAGQFARAKAKGIPGINLSTEEK